MRSMMKQATLIYNPHAGPGSWNRVMHHLVKHWQSHGWAVTVQPTKHGGHATELAREAAKNRHALVIAAGGDGTLNEVANGLVHTETIMAPMPTGTGNSFAKELQMPLPNPIEPSGLIRASEALLAGKVQAMDMGLCNNGRYWLFWISTGADSFIVDKIEPRSKRFKRLGMVGYGAKALYYLAQFPKMHATVTVDNQTVSGDFVLINISNCRLYGAGMSLLNANAVLDDGEFEVWLFEGHTEHPPWLTALQHTLEVSLERHDKAPHIQRLCGKQITVQSVPLMPFHVDAEPVGDTPFSCEIKPQSLHLLVPNTAPKGLFSQPGETLLNHFKSNHFKSSHYQ